MSALFEPFRTESASFQLSSAHVYLRLQPGQTLDDIPSQLIDDCAQLVKANS
uniref:Coiled-coil domain-containing protein 25 n=1 Tax=Plectus sambesii TaxID=2011161 RepID=A0A914VMG7_9BILA